MAQLLLIFMSIVYNDLMISAGYGKWLYGKHGVARGFLLLAVGAFLFMSLAGILISGMSMGMAGDMQGNMQGCPFMLGTSICHMSLFEHISTWQTMFVATGRISLILLAVLSTLVTLFFVSKYFYPPPRYFSTRKLTRLSQKSLRFTESLFEAFSSGVLNPKLF